MKKSIALKYQVLIIIAGIFICYHSVINAPFLWDDEVMVVGNASIKENLNLQKIFSSGAFGGAIEESSYYRPIQIFTYSLDYKLWGLNPKGFHVSNIILHILGCIVLLLFLREVFSPKISFITTLIFAIHPINIENVSYVSGRGDVLNMLFSFLCLLFFIKALKKQHIMYGLLAVAAYIIALFSKENTIFLPLVLIAFLLWKKKEFFIKKTYPIALLSLFLATMLGYIIFRYTVFEHGVKPLSIISNAALDERIFTYIESLVLYLQLLVMPFNYHMEYHFVTGNPFNIYTAVLIIIVFLLYWAVRKKVIDVKTLLFLASWFIIILIPVSNVIYPLASTIREHWVSFSSIAFFLLLAILIDKNSASIRKLLKGNLVYFILGGWFIYTGIYTVIRNKDWTDAFRLYSHDVKLSPDSFILWNNLGVEYFRKGDKAKAKESWVKSKDVCPEPGYAPTYNNLGVVEMNNNNFAIAIEYYLRAIKLDKYLMAYQNLGRLYLRLNKFEDAEKIITEGIAVYPTDNELNYLLNYIYSSKNPDQ